MSHVAAISVGATQLLPVPSLPDVDLQRAHLALGITYLASAREGVASKNIHTVGRQKE